MKKNTSKIKIPLVFCTVLFFFVGVTFGFANNIVLFAVFTLAGVMMFFGNSILSMYNNVIASLENKKYHTTITKQGVPSLEKFTKQLVRFQIFQLTQDHTKNIILQNTLKVGILNSPNILSRHVVVALFVSIVSSCIMILLAVLFDIIWLYLGMILPIIIWFYPRLSSIILAAERSTLYDAELAYFLSYLRIVHCNGMLIYDSMVSLVGRNIFRIVEKDGAILQKWVEYDDHTQLDAINQLAQDHPNKTFRQFLLSYYSIIKSSAQGLQSFIDDTADTEFEKIIQKDSKMAGKIAGVFIMGAMMMIMLPLVMMFLSFVGTDDNTIQLMANVLLLLPVCYAAFVLLLFRISTSDVLVPSKLAIFSAIPIIFAGLLIEMDILAILSLAISIPLLINGRIISIQMKHIKSLNDNFPIFMRDLIERRKVDSNFIISLKLLITQNHTQNRYGAWGDTLSNIDAKISNDHREELIYDSNIPSWRLKMLLFVFQCIFDNGGGSIHTLEAMHSFSVKINDIKNKLSDSIVLSSLILYVSPAMFFVSLIGVSVFLGSFNTYIPEIPTGMEISYDVLQFFGKPDFADIMESMKPVVFLMSLSSGVVISRIAHMTFLATTPIGICMGVSFVILVGWDYFFDILTILFDSLV